MSIFYRTSQNNKYGSNPRVGKACTAERTQKGLPGNPQGCCGAVARVLCSSHDNLLLSDGQIGMAGLFLCLLRYYCSLVSAILFSLPTMLVSLASPKILSRNERKSKQSLCTSRADSHSGCAEDTFTRMCKEMQALFCTSLVYSYLCNQKEKKRHMTQEEKTQIEVRIVDVIKTVYDPEIPVNIFDLGMIYKIDVQDDGNVDVDMTFTAPNCPAADFILEDVRTKIESVEGVKGVNVNLVFEPAWDQSMMSEEARVELGFD